MWFPPYGPGNLATESDLLSWWETTWNCATINSSLQEAILGLGGLLLFNRKVYKSMFPKMGVPQIIYVKRMFHCKPSSYWG